MIRFVSQIFCGFLALLTAALMINFALSNRTNVGLTLSPFPYHIELPVFLLMTLFFLAGLFLGLIFYLRIRIKCGLLERKLRRQMLAASALVPTQTS